MPNKERLHQCFHNCITLLLTLLCTTLIKLSIEIKEYQTLKFNLKNELRLSSYRNRYGNATINSTVMVAITLTGCILTIFYCLENLKVWDISPRSLKIISFPHVNVNLTNSWQRGTTRFAGLSNSLLSLSLHLIVWGLRTFWQRKATCRFPLTYHLMAVVGEIMNIDRWKITEQLRIFKIYQ